MSSLVSKITNYAMPIAFALGLGAASYNKTATTEYGVVLNNRTNQLESEILQPGQVHWVLPVFKSFYKLDSRFFNLQMIQTTQNEHGDLEFKTDDGNDIGVNMVISYRIDVSKLKFIFTKVGQTNEDIQKIVMTYARSIPRDEFGRLNTNQFIQANLRNNAVDNAETYLKNALKPYGIIIEKVSLGEHNYDKEFYAALSEMKKAEGNKPKIIERAKSQINANQGLLESAIGEYQKKVADANGAYQKAVNDADAYYKQKESEANAIRKEADNEAATIIDRRKAMMSAGGETLVKMEIAKALKGKPIIMYPNTEGSGNVSVQTFDVNQFLGLNAGLNKK